MEVDPLGSRLAMGELADEICQCRACPRLVSWREEVAAKPRAAFASQAYWGRPLSGFGDSNASLLVVGLAPAAHGGNRTGRIFTGDRSGDWLYRAMWRFGFANQPQSVSLDDGLQLKGAWVSAVVRCAPPANKPTPQERDRCVSFLSREISMLNSLAVIVALGGFAYEALARLFEMRPRMPFGHLREVSIPKGSGNFENVGGTDSSQGVTLLCSYHPSQRNTFTGLLTEPMFDAVFCRAKELVELR